MRTPFRGEALLRLFSSAVLDQGLLSAANFTVGLLLIRYAGNADYGYYVLAQSAVLLLISVQGAWISGPLAVLAPKRSEARRAEMIATVREGQQKFMDRLLGVGLLLPPIAFLLGLADPLEAFIGTAAVLAGWTLLKRELLRQILFVYGRPNSVLAVDLLFAGTLVITAAAAAFGPARAAVVAVLGMALAGWVFNVRAQQLLNRDPGWSSARDPSVWRELRALGVWGTTGASIYWIYGQGYNYVLAAHLDVTAVAAVNAARLLLMPTWVLTMGVKSLLNPSAAKWLHEDGVAALMRRIALFVVGLALLDSVYLLLVWLFRDWLTAEFLRTSIPDRDLLLLLWGAVTLLNMVRDMYQAPLLAMERYKPLAAVTATSAVAALLAMFIFIPPLGAPGAVAGMVVGEATGLLGGFLLLARPLRDLRRSRVKTPD